MEGYEAIADDIRAALADHIRAGGDCTAEQRDHIRRVLARAEAMNLDIDIDITIPADVRLGF